jgi:cysteine desulfurase
MIYLDHNATTPVDPRVIDAMLPVFGEQFANPSSAHRAGRAVAGLVEHAREQVAALVGVRRREVVFTSGATEAANLAVRGLLAGRDTSPRRVLVASTEHSAVLSAAASAVVTGPSAVELVRVHPDGTIDLDHLASLLAPDVALVAVMHANNETGVINDVHPIARLVHAVGAAFLCDVTQSAGKVPVRLADWEVDLALLSAHKIYGPKGVGALVARSGLPARLVPQMAGGGQERGLRSGTVNSPGVVGFGRAASIGLEEGAADAMHARRLVGRLEGELATRIRGIERNGRATERLPNTTNLWFPGAEADAVMTALPQVAVSSGSACHAAQAEPSRVLMAMGLSPERALESLRFSVGRTTTEHEVLVAADLVAKAVEHVRRLVAPGRDRTLDDAIARHPGRGTGTPSRVR